MTYGRDEAGSSDHLRASVLTYSDVQKWIRSIRKGGRKIRYFAVGEYGSEKGRAHWHVIVFNYGQKFDIPLRTNYYSWKYWPHGFTYADSVDYKSLKYVLKYITKGDSEDGVKTHLMMMSKKPPIGAYWFQRLAGEYIEKGIVPRSPEYTIPNVLKADGKNKVFWMTDTIKQVFLSEYLRLANQKGDRRTSMFIEESYIPPFVVIPLDDPDAPKPTTYKGVKEKSDQIWRAFD